ncbi:MAG: hypothetical protein WBP81_09425 [Solirubrobacteraceae bacterium]
MLYEAQHRTFWAPDYGWALRREEREARLHDGSSSGGRVAHFALAPKSSSNPRLRQWFARLERRAASPGTAAKLMRMNGEVDVRSVLGSIKVPTLVLHRAGDEFIDIRHSRYLAEHIPGARYVELAGEEALSFGADGGNELDEIEEFLTGARQARELERILATVMFSDLVDSTRRAAELGDRRWRDMGGEVDGRWLPGEVRWPGARD